MEKLLTSALIAVVILSCCLQGSGQKVEGGWGQWGSYTGCSKTCGMGLRTRMRSWVPGPDEPALEVPFTNTQQYTCFMAECPQNGSWSHWGIWGECSAGCGVGEQSRHRDCNNPPPMYNGMDCEGEKFDKRECNKDPCPMLPPNFNMSVCKAATHFTCLNKKMCVPLKERCDRIAHCSDGTDEVNCRGSSNGDPSHSSALYCPFVPFIAVFCVIFSSCYAKLFS